MQITRFRPDEAKRRQRRGATLIEVLAVMMVSSVLFGIAVVTLTSLQRADRGFRTHMEVRQTAEEIATRLRRDVRAAERFAWNGDDQTLRLTTPGGEILAYEKHDDRWERTRLAESGNADEELTSAFRLPERTTISVSPAEGETGQVVDISLEQEPAPQRQPPSPPWRLHLVATLGRDLRLLHE